MDADEKTLLILAGLFGVLWLVQQNRDMQSKLSSINTAAQPVGTLANTLNGYVPVLGDALVSWIQK